MPLGVILKSEKKSEMIEIIETLQQYVPLLEGLSGQKAHDIIFMGDQLTSSRARGFADLRINSETLTGRLSTLLPVSQDWPPVL